MDGVVPAVARDVDEPDLQALARATLDEHWAVAAVSVERRALLLERADAAALADGDGLGEPIADGLALLGTAYELAALGHLDDALRSGRDRGRALAHAVLTHGAANAFRCAAALRPPLDDGEAVTKWALRLGALALVGGQTDAFVTWWHQRSGVAEGVQRFAATLDQQPWEPYARGTLWLAWLGLLGAPVQGPATGFGARGTGANGTGDGHLAVADRRTTEPLAPLTAARTRLALFRERRASQVEPAEPTIANATALRARMTEFAIRHLADATELLTVAVLRRTLPDVSAEFKLRLSAARSALAGDHGQDVLLAWLQAAGVTLAAGVSAQLELPGF